MKNTAIDKPLLVPTQKNCSWYTVIFQIFLLDHHIPFYQS